MDAPKSKKAERVTKNGSHELVKQTLLGSKNGIDTAEGHEAKVNGKKLTLKRLFSSNKIVSRTNK
ncbi:MAG: hypothetical protein AAF849_22640 [Bacteroidota bacterium]